MRDAGGEHVVHPEAETQHRQRHGSRHDIAVAKQRGAGHDRQDGGDHSGGGKEDDVDLGVAEQPEEVLPEEGITAVFHLEERPAHGAFHLEQEGAEDHGGEGGQDHHRHDKDEPCEDRQA